MKKLLILLTLTMMFGQNIEYEDVVYLKNGTIIHGLIIETVPGELIQSQPDGEIGKETIIHGLIIETVPGELIKIQSGRSVFVYQMNEVEKITKEKVSVNSSTNKSDITYKKNSVGIGIFTNKMFNLIQYTHDFKISKGNSIFIMLGYGDIFGIGWTYQSNYNGNGVMIGWGGGIDIDDRSFGSFSAAYQWRLGNSNNFFSLGIASYEIEVRKFNYGYYGNYYTDEIEQFFMPVISIDTRF